MTVILQAPHHQEGTVGALCHKRRGFGRCFAADVCVFVWQGITGAFRPGVLTALMGVSGAGKTTLMDVLADRKTGVPPAPLTCVILLLPCQLCFRQSLLPLVIVDLLVDDVIM